MTSVFIRPSDINTSVNCVPRVHDLRLAEALGFSKPFDIRKLIKRHCEALEKLGELFFATVAKNTRGRPGKEYYLNEKQALYLCTKSEATHAIDLTIQMVEVFYQVRHGKALQAPQARQTQFDPAAYIQRARECGVVLSLADGPSLTKKGKCDYSMGGASHLLASVSRPRQHGGIFVPNFRHSLWRESGSGNARACLVTGVSSRRQGGLTASLVASFNAKQGAV